MKTPYTPTYLDSENNWDISPGNISHFTPQGLAHALAQKAVTPNEYSNFYNVFCLSDIGKHVSHHGTDRTLLDKACEPIGIRAKEIENVGGMWHARIAVDPARQRRGDRPAPAFIEDMATHMLSYTGSSYQIGKTVEKLHRHSAQHKLLTGGASAFLAGSIVTGGVVPHLVSPVVSPALAGTCMLLVAPTLLINASSSSALNRLERSMAYTVVDQWINAAAPFAARQIALKDHLFGIDKLKNIYKGYEVGSPADQKVWREIETTSRVLESNNLYRHGIEDVTKASETKMHALIDSAIHSRTHASLGFVIEIESQNPDLLGTKLQFIAQAPTTNDNSNNDDRRNRRKPREAAERDLSWLPVGVRTQPAFS